jgi:hypothetical protein
MRLDSINHDLGQLRLFSELTNLKETYYILFHRWSSDQNSVLIQQLEPRRW